MKKTALLSLMLAACAVSSQLQAREAAFSIGQGSTDWAFLVSGEGHATAGRSVIFESLDAAHSIVERLPEQYWIVVTVDMPDDAKVHTHSRRDVFK